MGYYSERLPYLTPMLKVVVLILLLIGLLLLSLYLSGEWLPSYDLHVTSVGVCTSKSPLTIELSVSASTEPIYLCGRAEGTTFLNADFLLFKDNSLIYRGSYKLEPGEFFFELPVNDVRLTSGTYRVDATFGRLTIAQSALFGVYTP